MLIACSLSFAQSLTTGDVSGTVTDPLGAVVPAATVTLTNTDTNVSQKTPTNGDGSYRFSYVSPGAYKIDVVAKGFQTQEHTGLIVAAGQPLAVGVQLKVATATQTVDVVEQVAVIQTENADTSSSFNQSMIREMANPGSDITYIAQTAPGVVMNTQSGYGNFVAGGMPAISNLFTINGQNYNDPFLGINNSGASNLSLGVNDISEATVITNAYSAQYGQYAGTQITYVTKSGTNQFHGDAIYNWNGRAMNADQFFSNAVGQPRPFNNFNQWATGVQGPIKKDRTFFDFDYEGLRNVLPTASSLWLVPSAQFEAATLANISANGNSAEIPFYKQLFAVYNNAPGVGAATPVADNGGCQNFTGLPAGVPCALQFRTTPPALEREYQWSARVDHTFSDHDRAYVRFLRDNGFQPTFTSPFGPTFNDQSLQPQMNGQFSEIHTFGPNTVNQLSGSALFYAASFAPADPTGALAALPTFMIFSGTPFTSAGAFGEPPNFYFPSGRRVFQYQLGDDLTHVVGKHTLRTGFSWFHVNVTDLDFEAIGGPIHGGVTTTLSDFFNGGGPDTSLNQAFPSSPEQSIRNNTFAGYVADDWKVTSHLTVSLNLRLEHYGNPTCDANCFSRLSTAFTGVAVPNAANIPYDQFILSGQHSAYAETQAVVWEPRLGIAWRPFGGDKTVIRMGAGVFADQIPVGLAEGAAFNSPGLNAYTISTANGTIAPGAPNSLFTTTAQANQALLTGFKSGGTFNSLSASVPGFTAPSFESFPNDFKQPTYYKWNVEVQQALGAKLMLSVNYSGMHGSHVPVDDAGLNAYCPPSVCPSGFAGLPVAPPNPALGFVQQYLSAGSANYQGLIVSLQRRLAAGISFNFNYTWSHALDDISNGGIGNQPFGILSTNESIQYPQNPFNLKSNYGDSDYDVRHYISATFLMSDIVRNLGFRRGPNRIFGGWTLSSNWIFRTGLPFTAVDTGDYGALEGLNYEGAGGGAIFASPAGKISASCNNAVSTPCLSASQFAPAGALTGFGTIGRNTLRGPHFFDVDMALMKEIALAEHVRFAFGAQFYNLFNHPNFDQPVDDINNPQFGSSIATVGPPTSLLGSFVGAGSSPRFIELKGVIRF
jgi:hypothetical protein